LHHRQNGPLGENPALPPLSSEYIVFGLPCTQSPGGMIEFEVMIRPINAPAARGEELGTGIRPQLAGLKELATAQG
jgi:hypothetical protein